MSFNCKVVYNKNNRLDKNNEAPINIYINVDGNRKFINTEIKIEPQYWDTVKEKITSKHPNHLKYNRIIIDTLQKIENAYLELIAGDKKCTLVDLLNKISNNNAKVDFVKWALDYMKTDNSLDDSTKKSHRTHLKKIALFKPGISIQQINHLFIKEFENHLLGLGLFPGTIWSHHKTLKSYLNRAISCELIKTNPYQNFPLSRPEGNRLGLEKIELEKLEKTSYPDNHTKQAVLDIFLFDCYTGLRFTDLLNLNKTNINFNNNEVILRLSPDKTRKKKYREVILHLDILFDGKPRTIFDKYYNKLKHQLFPVFQNQPFNRILKEISDDLSIRPLTAHIARHTFGTNLATVRPDPYLIMELMGLTEMSTALIYIHQSEARIKSKLEKINWEI